MAKNSLFLNAVSVKMLHKNSRTDGSKDFVNVTIPYAASKSGYASFGVNVGQVFDATRKDGTEIKDMKNVLLGKADGKRQLSICTKLTKKGQKTYGQIEVTNQQILDAFTTARASYKASLATATAEA